MIQTPLEKCIRFADRQQSPMEIIPENLFPFLNRDGLSQQFLIRGVKGKKWLGDDYFSRKQNLHLFIEQTHDGMQQPGNIRRDSLAEISRKRCLGKSEKYHKIELFSLNLFGSKASGGRT